MSRLFVMMGCPASGKTTFVRKCLQKNQVHVSRDAVRLSILGDYEEWYSREGQVYNEFVRRINDALNQGFDVFADATHVSMASRKKLLKQITARRDETNIVWIKTPLDECLKRNETRQGTRAYVPPEQLKKMYFSLSTPNFGEGFDKIFIYENGKMSGYKKRE